MRKDKLLFLFITSMRPLLESGLLIEEALNMLSSQSSNRNIRDISFNLLKSIKQGESLGHSLLSSSLKVPQFYLSLIKVFEANANLPEAFIRIEELEKEKKERKRSALLAFLYPVFVLFLIIALAVVARVYVIPQFLEIINSVSLDGSGIERLGRVVISARRAGFAFAVFIVAFILFVLFYKTSHLFRYNYLKLSYRLPLIRNIKRTDSFSKFSYLASTLSKSGIGIDEILLMSAEATEDEYIKEELKRIRNLVFTGSGITEAFSTSPVADSVFISFLEAGENTGDISSSFERMSAYYKNEMKNKRLLRERALEPVLTIITGVFVLWFVIGFVLPVLSILGDL